MTCGLRGAACSVVAVFVLVESALVVVLVAAVVVSEADFAALLLLFTATVLVDQPDHFFRISNSLSVNPCERYHSRPAWCI